MTYKVLERNIFWDLDGLSVMRAIEFLSIFPEKAKLDCSVDYDSSSISVYIEETREERLARLAAEKVAKDADKLEKERKRYLELKAKFEGVEL